MSADRNVTLVVSACASKDLDTWTWAAPAMLETLGAGRYVVAVPDGSVGEFRGRTPSAFEVVAESEYAGEWRRPLRERLRNGREDRIGWYVQQFAKINAARQAGGGIAVIWDADTVPVRRIEFTDGAGRLIYFKSREHHPPYFDLIREVLGLERIVDFSFVAQCFPARPRWLHAFCDAIEARCGAPWEEAVIRAIDPRQLSGFSEYESLGTFVSHRYPDEMTTTHAAWLRNGVERYGVPTRLTPQRLRRAGERYAYVAFEASHQPSWSRRLGEALRTS